MEGSELIKWMLVFLRVSALFAVFPLFSLPNIPVALRVALGALLTLLICPLTPPLAATPTHFLDLVLLMAREIGCGLLLGFVSRIFFHLLEFAGSIIGMELGLNLASTLNPFSAARSDATGMILFYLGSIIFLSLNLHHWLILAVQRSFTIAPLGGGGWGAGVTSELASRTSEIFRIGLLMAIPVIAASFLINLVFSVIGRAVPQMNIFVESMGIRIVAGLLVFALTLHLLAGHIASYLGRLPQDFLRVAQLFAQPGQ